MSRNYVEGEEAGRLEYAKWICPTKRAYKTRAEAKAKALQSLASSPELPALYVYKCQVCRMLHMTKKKRRDVLARQKVAA